MKTKFNDERSFQLLLELSDETKKRFGKEFTKTFYPEALKEYEEHRPPKTRSFSIDLH